MPTKKHRRKATTCPNCSTPLAARMNYCPTCGQENHDLRVPIGHLIYEVVEGFFHFDTKFWATTKALFTRPGQITKDFVEGRRARYVPPVRLYIFVSFVFFLLVTAFSDRGLDAGVRVTTSPIELTKRFTSELAKYTQTADSGLAAQVVRLSARRRDVLFDSLDTRRQREQTRQRVYSATAWKTYAELQVAYQLREQARTDSTNQVQLDSQRVAIGSYTGDVDKSLKLPFSVVLRRGDLVRVRRFNNQQVDSVLRANGEEATWFNRTLVRQTSRFFITDENAPVNAREQGRALLHKLVKNVSVLMFILMPVVAFLLWLLYVHQKKFYYEHLIFSIHFHTVLFLIFSVVFGGSLLVKSSGIFGWAGLLGVVYLLLAMRTVYRQNWPRTTLKFLLLTLGYFFCVALLLLLGGVWSFLTF